MTKFWNLISFKEVIQPRILKKSVSFHILKFAQIKKKNNWENEIFAQMHIFSHAQIWSLKYYATINILAFIEINVLLSKCIISNVEIRNGAYDKQSNCK